MLRVSMARPAAVWRSATARQVARSARTWTVATGPRLVVDGRPSHPSDRPHLSHSMQSTRWVLCPCLEIAASRRESKKVGWSGSCNFPTTEIISVLSKNWGFRPHFFYIFEQKL